MDDGAMERQSDRLSGNSRNVGNIGGRFGRDGNEIWMGFNGKVMEWNMVHDTGLVQSFTPKRVQPGLQPVYLLLNLVQLTTEPARIPWTGNHQFGCGLKTGFTITSPN